MAFLPCRPFPDAIFPFAAAFMRRHGPLGHRGRNAFPAVLYGRLAVNAGKKLFFCPRIGYNIRSENRKGKEDLYGTF